MPIDILEILLSVMFNISPEIIKYLDSYFMLFILF